MAKKKDEIIVILEGVIDEQKKHKEILDTISSEFLELDKDHLEVVKLKTEVTGLRNDFDALNKRLDKFFKKTADTVEDAVERGIQPALDMTQAVAEGLQSGEIPVSEKAAKTIKSSNWVNKFIKKWSKKEKR